MKGQNRPIGQDDVGLPGQIAMEKEPERAFLHGSALIYGSALRGEAQ